MTDIDFPFELSEYEERLNRTRSAMENSGIEVLIVVDPSNMGWLTGYDGWSFYVHQAVIITHDFLPLWWGRSMDGFGARRTVYMPHTNILSYGDEYIQSTERHAMDHLSLMLKEYGLSARRIGVEMENYYFSAAAYKSLEKNLPEATLLDATALVNWRRLLKIARRDRIYATSRNYCGKNA